MYSNNKHIYILLQICFRIYKRMEKMMMTQLDKTYYSCYLLFDILTVIHCPYHALYNGDELC